MGGTNTAQDQQLDCPFQDYTTSAQTQEGHAARLIEHMIDTHPGGLDPTVVGAIKEITGHFK